VVLVAPAAAAAAPETFLDAGPGAITNDARPAFLFHSDDEAATFECRFDFDAFAACASPFTPAAPLPDGRHIFSVRAVDSTGDHDESPAARDFFIDTSPPDTSISGPRRTTDPTPTFRLRSEAGATLECSIDSGEFRVCQGRNTIARLGLGSHVLRARSQDSAGNVDPTPAVRRFTVVLGVRVLGARRQPVLGRRAIVIRAGCPQESCFLAAGALVRVGGRSFALRSRTRQARDGRLVTLRVPLGPAVRRALERRLLAKRAPVLRAVVVVRAHVRGFRVSARRPVTLRA
jgi:hypothetical protein